MVEITIDGIKTSQPEGTTVLEAALEIGIVIPTLCYHPGLSAYGACRLCVVEVLTASGSLMEASCVLPVAQGQVILTNSEKVQKARQLVIELLLASCPNSKTLQDLAASMGVNSIRFKIKDRKCILCGRCIRYCKEQMKSGGLGFAGRGSSRYVATAFDVTPEECRNCGGWQWICPVCERACTADNLLDGLCGGCQKLVPVETCPVCTQCSESVNPKGHKVY